MEVKQQLSSVELHKGAESEASNAVIIRNHIRRNGYAYQGASDSGAMVAGTKSRTERMSSLRTNNSESNPTKFGIKASNDH